MNKKLPMISLFFMSIVSIMYWAFKPKDELYEAKWNAPDTTLAITINGEISTTFPTTNKYNASVECTRNGKKIDVNEGITWNGTKWILTTAISDGNVRCNATFESLAPAPNGWYEAGSGTLLASLRDSNTLKIPLTTPGAAISTADEALLASAVDDYGTSYYFRGAVTNNYVEFANKCWRIVRVGGDGSVKLILHNDNATGVANPCDAANNSASAAFARYSGTTYKSAFNENYDDNAYVGFKYGTASASDYDTTHANINNSTILNNLETWYNNNLKTYESVIDDTVWCNDKTNVTDTTFNPYGYSNVNGYGYAKNVTYYGVTQRLVSKINSAGGTGPSLKCNGELSKINSKVGLITADELVFAGYAAGLQNSTTYLQENATDTWWWSLSPNSFRGSVAYVWGIVSGSSGDFNYSYVSGTHGLRPSISLVSSTIISGGSGTSEDPYVVK